MRRCVLALAAGMFLFPSLAFAEPWVPGPHAQGDSSIIGYIDDPKAEAVVKQGEKFTLLGWVVDSTATGWTGIDEVHVYRGTAADQYLGRATIGGERPDVGVHFGNPGWQKSGFTFSVDSAALPFGTQVLTVYAHTPMKGWWSRSVSIRTITGPASADGTLETVNWRTPHGHSVATQETLKAALAKLAETPWGNWALDIAADRGLQVLWSSDLADRFSVYQYGSRVILVNAAHKSAETATLAAAIAHELQHAIDDTYGWASWRAVSCEDLESRAFLAQAAAWNWFYGPFGKVQAFSDLEDAHNVVLRSVSTRPPSWLEEAIRKYRSPCS